LADFDGYQSVPLAIAKYMELENIPPWLRGTLEEMVYCKGWDVFITIGMTDDSSTELPKGTLRHL